MARFKWGGEQREMAGMDLSGVARTSELDRSFSEASRYLLTFQRHHGLDKVDQGLRTKGPASNTHALHIEGAGGVSARCWFWYAGTPSANPRVVWVSVKFVTGLESCRESSVTPAIEWCFPTFGVNPFAASEMSGDSV